MNNILSYIKKQCSSKKMVIHGIKEKVLLT